MKKKFLIAAVSLVFMSAVFAGCESPLSKGESTTTSTSESSDIPVYTLPQNDGTSTKTDGTSAPDDDTPPNTGTSISSPINYGEPDGENSSSGDYTVGSYIVNTATDPLSLRLKPSAGDDNVTIRSIPKGTKINVIAVKDDWGYVVYSDTGGWVSMKFLKQAS
ncbi:MAG TPA: hypothetical protein VFC76_09065 [Oscillospiraceae bacterium]|nr:hypothetical protein [Oscillospiraceae bacterium]